MKLTCAIGYLITALILGFCIRTIAKSKKNIAKVLLKMTTVAEIAVIIYVLIIFSNSKDFCMVMYTVYYLTIPWLLYYVLMFVMEYVGEYATRYVNKPLIGILIAVDSINIAINLFTKHMFRGHMVTLESGEQIYSLTHYSLHLVHLAIAYIIMLHCFILLIYQGIRAPIVYRKKYWIISTMLLTVVLVNAGYVYNDGLLDISVFGFSIGAILISYYALFYEPSALLNKALSMVVKDITAAIIMFDAEGHFLRANNSAKKLFDIEEKNTEAMKELEEGFLEWLQERNVEEYDGHVWDKVEKIHGEERHLSFKFHCMWGARKNSLGYFFVIQDNTENFVALQKEHYLATRDRLTDLYNKSYFYEMVRKKLEDNPNVKYLMICADVKNFKFVNDVFGTKAGDELLANIANELKEQTIKGEIYGRLDADRFALLMPLANYKEEIFYRGPSKVAFVSEDIHYPIHIFVGVYEITDKQIPISVMCDRAFLAINSVKGNYRGTVAYYDDILRKSVLREQELAGELPNAIATEQFQLYLQPQITDTNEVPGAEALVRWRHPKKGTIMPGEFIPVFEKNGMIVKLDQYMWEAACKQLRKWKDEGKKDMYISVNISPKDFYFMDVKQVLTDLVKKYNIEPQKLKLEITETAIMTNIDNPVEILDGLRKEGFIIEMDDFGSGYSSLNMLKDIYVDILKIDMAFLRKSNDEERGRKILKTMIQLAKDLEMPTITEGVETLEQVEFLKAMGCKMFQGYYFAKPMDVATFEEKYM